MSSEQESVEEIEENHTTNETAQQGTSQAEGTNNGNDAPPETEEIAEDLDNEVHDESDTEPNSDSDSWNLDPVRPDDLAVTTTDTPALDPRIPDVEGVDLVGSSINVIQAGVQTTYISTHQSPGTGIQTVRPQGRIQSLHTAQVQTSDVSLGQMMPESPRTIQVGEELLELEDPFYVWTGGEPYDTGRPSVVIHVSPENRRGDSLAFLQRRLRDEYTQRQGDEPGAKRVRIVANKPKLPDLAGTVATFDLTEDEWELETSSDRIRVERNGRDALEYVEAVVRSSFTGDMGYLIVNVPSDWQDPVNTRDVFERIHDRLEPSTSAQTSDWLPDDRSDAERPLVTRCEPKASIDPQRDAALYWFGESLETDCDTNSHLPESVEGYEALFDEKLRRFDWVSSVLTEQDDDESEEHYLLKGAVTAALARRLYEHESNEKKLEEYVLSTLLSQEESVLDTEHNTDRNHSLDCYVEWSSALKSFVSVPEEFSGREGNLIVEVETGRGGGNTNFRKIWDTIERVKTAGHDDDLVCVVVPPRLLSKTDAQAEHLLDLVSLWNRRVELDSEGGPLATLAVPVFDQDGACEELRAADEFVKEVYSGE